MALAGFFMAILLSVNMFIVTDASGFLVTPRRSASISGSPRTSAREFDSELSEAMSGALGCGSQVGHEDLARIEQKLEAMWRTLPTNSEGNVERRSLRYAVHRYFNREWSLHIRGFEPSRPLNPSGWGADDILGQRVPAFVESVLESQHKAVQGFTLRDAATMIATIEQLIYDSESALLEHVYETKKRPTGSSLGEKELLDLLEFYMVQWLLRTDDSTTMYLLASGDAIEESIPHWKTVKAYIVGQLRSLEFQRQQTPEASRQSGRARAGHNALVSQFSFEDVHYLVASITKSFAGFWDSECESMKAALYRMDTHRTGRVPLAQFYGRGIEADWRFGESEPYLRELGALDETGWRGKQVLISNYMQAASNCVVSTAHYLVCCTNNCEMLLDEIEREVGASSVRPATLLALVSKMNDQSTVDDDFPTVMEASLVTQLYQISSAHGGEVPLHGRLFAQWLHYAFPRSCAFPHKAGVAATVTPAEYGESYYASSQEMLTHVADVNSTVLPMEVGKEELQWMSQWSEEEELISEMPLKAPWERTRFALGSLMLVIVAGVLGFVGKRAKMMPGTPKKSPQQLLPNLSKQHFV